jgi:hypothetical protein
MSTDEQRVRTVCGWIGVEISKSRVRTPGKAGFGLYRVRGSLPVQWSISRGDTEIDRSPGQGEPTLWTAYAFTLEEIETAARGSINRGTPTCPGLLTLPNRGGAGGWPADRHFVTAPTRWTSAYQGRRDLGVAGAGLGEVVKRSTVKSRQREQTREFQAAHKERRRYGKAKRHAAVLARNAADRNEEN